MNNGRGLNGLPTTAYLVLGVLATNDEQLTAGEIKFRAELSVGYFYWSPSVSHVRRELGRLLERGMVTEARAEVGKRSVTVYEVTDDGLDALHRWVQQLPGSDQVVVKHPVILRTWLAQGGDPTRVIESLEHHLSVTRVRLDEALWMRQRSRDIGLASDPERRFSYAVLNYSIRDLYAELSNIEQLRDDIATGTDQDPVLRVHRPKGQLRRRLSGSAGEASAEGDT